MGSGGSTASVGPLTGNGSITSADGAGGVTCPLFYNGMPNKQVIPDGILPHYDMRRVLKSCAARVTTLRSQIDPPDHGKPTGLTSPIVSFLSSSPGASPGCTVGVAEACLSAPHLIAFTVDADGRLAPSDGEGVRAAPTTSGVPGIKGFNFKKTDTDENNTSGTTQLNSSTTRTHQEVQPNSLPSPSLPSALAGTRSPSSTTHTKGSDGAQNRSSPPTNGAVCAAPNAPDAARASDSSQHPVPNAVRLVPSTDSASPSVVPSVLVKESKLLTREGSVRKDGGEFGSGRGAGLGGKKRSSKRLARLQVPNRTRYCFYNDSLTHEAQITFTVHYRRSADPMRATKVLCIPTPHVALANGARPNDALNSASRTFVEVCEDESRVNPQTFAALLGPLATPAEKHAQDTIRPASEGGAAAQVRLVLAPGATVAAVESPLLLGYHIACSMVPFDAKKSLAVMGRYASPEQVAQQFGTGTGPTDMSAVAVALANADAKNKAQVRAKNKPIKLSLRFLTQHVREDTTDADGWSEGPSSFALPSPSHSALRMAAVTTHARAALERHLADVPYVNSTDCEQDVPSSATSRGSSRQSSPRPTLSRLPSTSQTSASTLGGAPLTLPPPQQQLSARGSTTGVPAVASTPSASAAAPLARSSRHGSAQPGSIPPPPPLLKVSGGSGATGQSSPSADGQGPGVSRRSVSSAHAPRLAEPPSPTRSQTGRQPRLSGSHMSTSTDKSHHTSPLAGAGPSQRSLAAGALPLSSRASSAAAGTSTDLVKMAAERPSDAVRAPPTTNGGLVTSLNPGEVTAAAKRTSLAQSGDFPATALVQPLSSDRPDSQKSNSTHGSFETQSLDDLGISF